ncbi:hypothetical protein ACF053_06605 [Streptomyces kanasensis]|uniref:hypothetical protein n=1 Tax=Streptomyces kanasensis TaxID=936756 RepID=UPI0036FF0EEE
MLHLDRRLIGGWRSAPFDVGAMETSDLVFLADGRGWSRFESISSELGVSRFRWHCPDAGVLEMRHTWQVDGRWGSGDGFAAVDFSGPDDEVVRTGYRIGPETPPYGAGPVDTLVLDRAVAFTTTYARGQRTVSTADDPSAAVVPYTPAPRPAPPGR